MTTKSLLLVIITGCLSCESPKESTPDAQDGWDGITAASFANHVKVLSSDDFMGRMPFTEGETKTLSYLQQVYREAGLLPGNGDTYLQPVPLVSIKTKAADHLTITGTKNLSLKGFDDYVLWTPGVEKVDLTKDELVFAGFGVTAPEYSWDDFKDVDVAGKIILVLVNDPGFGSTDTVFFKGNTMTYYGRWTYKFEEAARRGAKGCLVIHDDAPAGYAFGVLQNSWNTNKLYLDPRESKENNCAIQGWITRATAEKLFKAAGSDYASKLAEAHEPDFKPQSLNLFASTTMEVETKYDTSYNVIGTIAGSERPDEYVIYTAHWDHLGIGTPDETGDSIYNGALDNASGVAALLELAKGFKSMHAAPKRSIAFIAVTAEEQGLLGADYYSKHPLFPLKKTVADINIDGVNPYGKMKDIVLIGAGQSDLEDDLRQEAENMGRYVAPEAFPEAGYFFRSDHFCFAKVGVPALYTETGIDLVSQGKVEGKRLADEYVQKYYHQPGDEYDSAKWKLDGAIDDIILLFQVGKKLSMEESWPQWKEGSEFKSIREAYLPPTETNIN